MDDRMSKDQNKMLMKALFDVKDYSRKLQEKREKKLWRELDIHCSLSDAVNGL